MKRKAFVQEYMGRMALTLLLLCLIVYTVFHALGNSSGSLLTTPARTISDTTLLGGRAWLFRDETLLTVPRAGLVNPVARSGAKVGKNAPLVRVYTGLPEEELEAAQRRLELLNRTVAVLEAGMPSAGESVSSADGYRDAAIADLRRIREAIRAGNWSVLSQLEEELLVNLNRYGALTGDLAALKAALEQARADRDACLTGAMTQLSNEVSSSYFYDLSAVDGYETLFSEAALESLTPESFEALKGSAPVTSEAFVVGKLAYGYSWHLAVEFSEGGELFEPTVSYRMRFPENDGAELVLTCERVMPTQNGGSAVIFRSDVTPLSFRYLRVQSVEITVGETEGLYIPEQAYRELNGMMGVYVFEESTVRFRRIAVCYRGNGYYIALMEDDNPQSEVAYLKLNDLIVTSGKNLYDGKVYR